jgi:FkbM family methyltransferase
MRPLVDLRDWLALRRFILDPRRFVRLRRRTLAEPTYRVVFRAGGFLTLRTAHEDRQIFLEIFARDEYRMADVARRGVDTVIDVGAHVGIFAARAAPFSRRVLSFEPAPDTFAVLTENLASLRLANVTAVPAAVAGRGGTAELRLLPKSSGNTILPGGGGERVVTVPAISLAELFERHSVDRCDVLKLDCEGAEYPILLEAPRPLLRRIDRVAMEFHPAGDAPPSWSPEGLAAALEEAGHRVTFRRKLRHPGTGFLFSERA